MKKQIINCTTGKVSVVEIGQEEEQALLQASAEAEAEDLLPKPKTADERIAELEEKIKTLTQ